jgi:hypothetical protein
MEQTETQKPIVVGQTLYQEIFNRNAHNTIEEVVVGKVGKKYFYLTGWKERYPIDKKTLEYRSKEYTQSNFQLYRSKQDIIDEREHLGLVRLIESHTRYGGHRRHSLSELRQVCEIFGISLDEKK